MRIRVSTCKPLTTILEEDEVGVYSVYYYVRQPDRLQSASTLLTTWVSTSPIPAL